MRMFPWLKETSRDPSNIPAMGPPLSFLGKTFCSAFCNHPFMLFFPIGRGQTRCSSLTKVLAGLSPFQSCLYLGHMDSPLISASFLWESSQDRSWLWWWREPQLYNLYLGGGLTPGDKKQEAHFDQWFCTNFTSTSVCVWFLSNFYMCFSSGSEFKRKGSVVNWLP